MKMFKKEVREWNKAINKYEKKASTLFKKIKATLKKKKFSPEEKIELIDYFGKFHSTFIL